MPEPNSDTGVVLTVSDRLDAAVELPAETWQTALETASSIGWSGPPTDAAGHLAAADTATLGAALQALGDPALAAASALLVAAGERGAVVTVVDCGSTILAAPPSLEG